MFFWANIIGSCFLVTEGFLAYLAFSALKNPCVPPADDPHMKIDYPCRVSKLYNENFLDIPVLSAICNFYPMLNIAAVPILNITLRNNLMDVIPIKQYLKRKNCCHFLIQDHRNVVKGVWSIILSLPVFAVVLVYRDVQTLISWTGGFCGGFILLLFPAILT